MTDAPPPAFGRAGRLHLAALALAMALWALGGSGPARLDATLAWRPWHLWGVAGWWAGVCGVVTCAVALKAARRGQSGPLSRQGAVGLAAALTAAGWLLRPRRPSGDFLVFEQALRAVQMPDWTAVLVPQEPLASALHAATATLAARVDPSWLVVGFQLPSSVAGAVGLAWIARRGDALCLGRVREALVLWCAAGVAAVWWGDAEHYAWPVTLLLIALVESARATAHGSGAMPAIVAWATGVSAHLLVALAAPGIALLALTRGLGRPRDVRLGGMMVGLSATAVLALWGVAGVTPYSLRAWMLGALTGGTAGSTPALERLDALGLLMPWALGGIAAFLHRPHLDATERVLLASSAAPMLVVLVGPSTLGPGGDWNLWALCVTPLAAWLVRRLVATDQPAWALPTWAIFGAACVSPWLASRAWV